jgi:hypothetical protein
MQQAEMQFSSDWLMIQLCAILFTCGRQLQRLSVSADYDGFLHSNAYLQCEIINHMSIAATLESLALLIPESRTFRTLAESVPSLQKLKVRARPCLASSFGARLRCMLIAIDTQPGRSCSAPRRSWLKCAAAACAGHAKSFARLIPSMQVVQLEYVGLKTGDSPDSAAAESAVRALCCCPLLEDLKLLCIHMRCAA